MIFETENIPSSDAYKLLIGSIVPRPIALVTTINADGVVNAAPFSFFNAMGSDPPVLALGFEPSSERGTKDTPTNILNSGEFVVNIVSQALATPMNICAAGVDPGVSELSVAGLESRPSVKVSPPCIKLAPVSMECRQLETVTVGKAGLIVIGEVVAFHVRDDLLDEDTPFRINLDKLAAISRLSGSSYGTTTDRFEIQRPT